MHFFLYKAAFSILNYEGHVSTWLFLLFKYLNSNIIFSQITIFVYRILVKHVTRYYTLNQVLPKWAFPWCISKIYYFGKEALYKKLLLCIFCSFLNENFLCFRVYRKHFAYKLNI